MTNPSATFTLQSNSNDNDGIKKDNMYEKYIIVQNQTLQDEIIKCYAKSSSLQKELEDLEKESDRMENKITNLKNLLKNFHEIDKLRKELCQNHVSIDSLKNHQIHDNQYKTKTFFYYKSSISAILMAFLFFKFYLFDYIILWLMFSTIYYIEYYTIKLNKIDPNTALLNSNKELTTEISKILKGQDYIHEFLDSQ